MQKTTDIKQYLESVTRHLEGVNQIRKLQGEASTRNFFRISRKNHSLVAMVYPEKNKPEIQRIACFTELYKQHQLRVPYIVEIIDDRVILQQDLGDTLIQRVYKESGKETKKQLTHRIGDMLLRLGQIPTANTAAVLDHARMKWEMDFFVTHYASNFCPPQVDTEVLRETLHRMVDRVGPIDTFAHRDFHSRNMLFHRSQIHLVDYQDSLVAPRYYDLVSFAFDAYLDLGALRRDLIETCKTGWPEFDEEQYYLTALQRNIKALGTFGNQITIRQNLTYKKYIPRTIRHILQNPLYPELLKKHLAF